MHKRIYLTGIEKKAGKSFISIGVVAMLKQQYPTLRCFKLFSEDDPGPKELLEAVSCEAISPVMEINSAIALLRDHPEDLFSSLLQSIKIKDETPLSYFEGSDFASDNGLFEYEFNLNVAYQLGCSLILVVSAKDRTLEHTLSLVSTAIEMAKKNHAEVVGLIVNRVPSSEEERAKALFHATLTHEGRPYPFITIVPEFDALANPAVTDIVTKLKARVICGANELNRTVKQITIAAKTVGNFLCSRLDREAMLIITPDDRIDILLGSLLADQSAFYPKIAGIVLTGGEMPDPIILELISGLEHPFPVLLTAHKTYETATLLYSAKYSLSSKDKVKIDQAIKELSAYLAPTLLSLLASEHQQAQLTPAIFLYELIRKAQKVKRHIVLPEGEDPRILIAADYLLQRDLVELSLLGKPEHILRLAKRLQLNVSAAHLLDIETAGEKEAYAQEYFKLRQHKNVNLTIARERMSDLNYFAAMMVYLNQADGMVSGAQHTTADTVRPALEIIKTQPGLAKVSSVFIMCLPKRVLIYGDCAINPEPDSQMLAEISFQAVDIAKRLGIEPKLALLSYSSGDSGKGESVLKVAKAMELIRSKAPDLLAEGPIQYDAAVDPEVAAAKLPFSKLSGQANILIFPDLNTGNNTYKAVQRETGALAIGPVLLGLNKPVNDLSRGCTAQDIINTVLITAIQAGEF